MDNELYDDLFMGQWSRVEGGTSPEDAFLQKERQQRLRRLLSAWVGTLTEFDRTVLRHCVLEYSDHVMSTQEISSAFGDCAHTLVFSRSHNAHRILFELVRMLDAGGVSDLTRLYGCRLTEDELIRYIGRPRQDDKTITYRERNSLMEAVLRLEKVEGRRL